MHCFFQVFFCSLIKTSRLECMRQCPSESGALSWWMMEPEATAFTIMDDGAPRHRIPVPFLFSNRDRPWTGRWEGENCTWESGADIKARYHSKCRNPKHHNLTYDIGHDNSFLSSCVGPVYLLLLDPLIVLFSSMNNPQKKRKESFGNLKG